MPDVPGGVGRLLARARRPALDPWTGPPPPVTLEEIQPAPGPDSTVPERVPAPLEAPPLPEARAERTAATVTPAAEPVAPAGGRASPGPAPAAEPAAAAPAGAAGGETRPSGRPPVRRPGAAGAEPEPFRPVPEPLRPVPAPRSEPGAAAPAPLAAAESFAAAPVTRGRPRRPESSERTDGIRPAVAPEPAAPSAERLSAAPAPGSLPTRGRARIAAAPEAPAPPRPSPTPAAADVLGAAAVPSSPTVVIDEIRIVTPPAPAPPADPLASLAERRVGASRHRGGRRWPA